MPHKIVFDRQSCSAFFSCVEVDPDDFERDDDTSKLLGGTEVSEEIFEKEISDDQLEAAKEAALVCPVDAIKIVDDDGNVVAGPEKLPIER